MSLLSVLTHLMHICWINYKLLLTKRNFKNVNKTSWCLYYSLPYFNINSPTTNAGWPFFFFLTLTIAFWAFLGSSFSSSASSIFCFSVFFFFCRLRAHFNNYKAYKINNSIWTRMLLTFFELEVGSSGTLEFWVSMSLWIWTVFPFDLAVCLLSFLFFFTFSTSACSASSLPPVFFKWPIL